MKRINKLKMTTQLIISVFALLSSSCKKETIFQPDLESRIISIAKENHIPTLSVQVSSVAININFKYKDADKNIEPPVKYGIASTTKFLSALVVLKLIEENKLELNEPILKYINSAELRNISWANSITIRNLLSHTSGIPDYTKNALWTNAVIAANPPSDYAQKIALIGTPDTSFQLGKYSYSNSNYVILEKIVQVVTKKDAQQVLNDFYAALNLPEISFINPIGSNQAFFAQGAEQIVNVSAWEEKYGFEGGAFATATDLSRILKKVFIDKTVLSQSSLESLMSWTDLGNFKINYGFGQMTKYGLGLMKFEFNGRFFIGHAGSSLKYQSFVFIEPVTGAEIIMQTNCSGKFYNNVFFIKILGEIVKAM